MSNRSLSCVSSLAGRARDCVAAQRGTRWLAAGKEPSLEEVLADPLIGLVMRRDGVSPAQLRAVVALAQIGLRERPCCREVA
jgi:hypothetical protein